MLKLSQKKRVCNLALPWTSKIKHMDKQKVHKYLKVFKPEIAKNIPHFDEKKKLILNYRQPNLFISNFP